jgi:hypothetical protein
VLFPLCGEEFFRGDGFAGGCYDLMQRENDCAGIVDSFEQEQLETRERNGK